MPAPLHLLEPGLLHVARRRRSVEVVVQIPHVLLILDAQHLRQPLEVVGRLGGDGHAARLLRLEHQANLANGPSEHRNGRRESTGAKRAGANPAQRHIIDQSTRTDLLGDVCRELEAP
eukprot:4188931-Pyramimonas_sp.AAC.1